MAGFWPQVTDPANRVAAQFNSCPKYVVTATLDDLAWSGAVPLRGDIPEQVAELKQTPGRELQIHGSGALARSLMPHGLIDAYRLVIFPVVLGRGQRLFANGTPPAAMRLVDSRSTSSGVVMHTYEAAGAPAFGSVQPGDVINGS
jgi:dihydrofolate reductase